MHAKAMHLTLGLAAGCPWVDSLGRVIGTALRRFGALSVLALALVLGTTSLSPSLSATVDPADRAARTAEGGPASKSRAITKVLAISVDGLNPKAITKLGKSRAPTFYRLMRQGAFTLNARTEREMTVTLPNHTGMVTGRRIDASRGGHGVTWNDSRLAPNTVQKAAGHAVSSVFKVVHHAGGSTAVFAGKKKFSLFQRSWSDAVDRLVILTDNDNLVSAAVKDLVEQRREFTFLHLSLPDSVGHEEGFMSRAYLDAVAKTDAHIGEVLRVLKDHPRLKRHLAVIVTADHGGRGENHRDATKRANYRIPFLVWGPGVARGVSLYDLNRDYRDPGKARTRYAAKRQPVRNGDVANLSLDLLGLHAVPRSEHNARQNLDVFARR